MIKDGFIKNDYLFAGILAVVLSFTLFGNSIGGDFVFDDAIVIVGNPFIDGTLGGFSKIFTQPYFAYQPSPGLYRPFTIASYVVNAFIFGQSPAGFHIVNILLHALTSFLVFVLLYRLSGRIAAFTGFLFFMFLPIHVEAVTSIVGRAEILSLIFVISALLAYLSKKYIFASGLFFLGLLSKEMAVAFLPIFLFLELFGNSTSQQRFNLNNVLKKLLYFVPPIVLYAVLRYVALGKYFLQNDATPVYNPIKFAQFLSGLATSLKVFYSYLEKIFYPVNFSNDYSFNQIQLVSNPLKSWEAMIGVGILTLMIFIFFRIKDLTFRLGLIIFLGSYFVVSNWVFKTGTIMAERLMYTPSLGLAILAASAVKSLEFKVKNQNLKFKIFNFKFPLLTLYFPFLTLLIWYGYVIIDRNQDWLNNENLYESAYEAAPESVVNKVNKAYLDFVGKNYVDAEKRLNEVLELAPDHVSALNLAGQNHKKIGQYQQAEELWKRAIEIRKDYLRAYLSLGVLYYENGYFKSAEKVLTDAVNIYPRWSEILFLALAKVGLDKNDEAIMLIEKFSEDNYLRKELKFALGWAYFNKSDNENAFKYFNQTKDPDVSMEEFVKTFQGSRVVILGEF